MDGVFGYGKIKRKKKDFGKNMEFDVFNVDLR